MDPGTPATGWGRSPWVLISSQLFVVCIWKGAHAEGQAGSTPHFLLGAAGAGAPGDAEKGREAPWLHLRHLGGWEVWKLLGGGQRDA